MPRIRDLADQQLYRIDRDAVYPKLAGIFRGGVDVDLIPEQWDQLVRVAASLKNRVCPAHVVVQRLANSSPSDRLAKALTMLGRVVTTGVTAGLRPRLTRREKLHCRSVLRANEPCLAFSLPIR